MIKDRYDDLARLPFLFISTFRPFRTCLETTTFRVKRRHRRFLFMNWFMCQPLKLQTSLQSKANIYLNESSLFPRFVHRLGPVSGWCDRTCICSFGSHGRSRRNTLTCVSCFTSQAPHVNSTLTSVPPRPARTELLALTNLVITSASVRLLLKVMSTWGMATISKVN